MGGKDERKETDVADNYEIFRYYLFSFIALTNINYANQNRRKWRNFEASTLR